MKALQYYDSFFNACVFLLFLSETIIDALNKICIFSIVNWYLMNKFKRLRKNSLPCSLSFSVVFHKYEPQYELKQGDT